MQLCAGAFSALLYPFSPGSPAFPMGEVTERGGLAHQSNVSLIVAPMWVSVGERMIGKRKVGWGKESEGGLGGPRDTRVRCLTKARANDSSKESQVLGCAST